MVKRKLEQNKLSIGSAESSDCYLFDYQQFSKENIGTSEIQIEIIKEAEEEAP